MRHFGRPPGASWKASCWSSAASSPTAWTVLRDAFNTCRQTGWRLSYPEFKGALAAALAGLGQLGEALEAVNDAIASAGQRRTVRCGMSRNCFASRARCCCEQGPSQSVSWPKIALSGGRDGP